MTLDEAPVGTLLEVVGTRAPSGAVNRRLAELGVRPGALVTLLSRTSGGGGVLAIDDDRLAVSREILRGILVDEWVPARA